MERDALVERIRAAPTRCWPAVRSRRWSGRSTRRVAHGAQGARLQGDRGVPGGRPELDEARERIERATRLCEAPADLDAEAGGRRGDRPDHSDSRGSGAAHFRRLDCRAHAVREMAGARQRLHHRRARRSRLRAHPGAGPADLRAAFRRPLRRRPADLPAQRPGASWPRCGSSTRTARGRAVGQRRARGDPVPAPPRLDRRRRVLDRDGRRRDPADDHLGQHVQRRRWAARGCARRTFRPAATTGVARCSRTAASSPSSSSASATRSA